MVRWEKWKLLRHWLIGLRAINPANDSLEGDLGPDQALDLRFQRPYYLLTLSSQQSDEATEKFRARVLEAIEVRRSEGKPFTDVFVLSHGWHRNLFGAVAAYDRLVGRLIMLRQSGRLPLLFGADQAPSDDEKQWAETHFHPLFICLHWHSDPGQDRWEDAAGRRDKASFLENARHIFAHPAGEHADFMRDFECLFEIMSQMSAPGKDAFSDADINERAPKITECLLEKTPDGGDRYQIQGAPHASLADKVALLWTCYHEATPRGPLVDQTAKSGVYLSFTEALTNLAVFVARVLGLALIAGILLPKLLDGFSIAPWLAGLGHALGREGWQFFARNGREMGAWLLDLRYNWQFWRGALELAVALVFCLVVLGGAAFYKQSGERARRLQSERDPSLNAQVAPVVPAVFIAPCWVFAQIVCLAPALAFLFFTYILGRPIAAGRSLIHGRLGHEVAGFERLGKRGKSCPNELVDDEAYVKKQGLYCPALYKTVFWARFPAELASLALAGDSFVASWVNGLNAILAFFDMQGRGVESGARAAQCLEPVFDQFKTQNPNVRFHLLGHSFGGLVACNLARQLCYNGGEISSLCLVQAAISSNWFEGETPMLQRLKIVADIYSVYDSANGFYYPMTNQGRCAAGFVGLFDDGQLRPIARGRYTALVRPPDLDVELQSAGRYGH